VPVFHRRPLVVDERTQFGLAFGGSWRLVESLEVVVVDLLAVGTADM
jgi:hypothetical protein